MKEELLRYKDAFVKIVYNDGSETSVVRGDLISVSDDFVEVQSLDNVFLVKIDAIIKIQKSLNKRGDYHDR